MTLQLASFKWNCQHIVTMNITTTILIMCLSIALYLSLDCFVCSIDVQPEPEATPFVEDPVIETSLARQATPPLIMSIKTQFPLFLLCMNRMITLCRFYRIVEPISFAWPIILSR